MSSEMACRAGAATENKLRSAQQLKEGESDPIPDVTLQVEGEKFYVNRKQLALQSPYFRALFFGSGIESTKRQVCIKGVDLQHFQVLMEHSRTSRLALSRENVQGILETADFLQLERARLLCCKFLERQLHITNCLGMMAYAWRLGCNQLYKAARQVALSHFPALLAEEEFLSLPKEAVADLLASDDLAIANDDLALEATLRWVSVHPERGEHLLELAGLVRPESLSVSFITQLLTRMKSSEPRAELIRTLNHGFPASWSAGQPRRATRARESLFVLGGPHDQEQQWLYQFHPLSGRWQRCAPLQRKNLTQYSVAAVGNSVPHTRFIQGDSRAQTRSTGSVHRRQRGGDGRLLPGCPLVQCGLGEDIRVSDPALGGRASPPEVQAQPLLRRAGLSALCPGGQHGRRPGCRCGEAGGGVRRRLAGGQPHGQSRGEGGCCRSGALPLCGVRPG